MPDDPTDNVVHLPDATPIEAPPTIETLLASNILVWDEGETFRLRMRPHVTHAQVAAWLRHIAVHIEAGEQPW